MTVKRGILNSGKNSWVFEELAEHLSNILNVKIVEDPVDINYILSWRYDNLDNERIKACKRTFIPYNSIKLASNKIDIAKLFKEESVPHPKTYLCKREEINSILEKDSERIFCVKWPIGCGGQGHKIIKSQEDINAHWPEPIILQEFIQLEKPSVYRMYCAGGKLFGWNKREFPEKTKQSPWVAHARGARYIKLDPPNEKILDICRHTFRVTGLYESFGCIDLIKDKNESYYVLEVGTDGIFNYVCGVA